VSEATLSPKRVNGIGGSEAAAVLGLSPWKTPYQVWCDKLGLSGEQETTPAMEWGTRLEPVVRQKYADETGRTVSFPVGDEYGHMQSVEHPFMLATLDGITDDGRGLEIKTSRSGAEWGDEGTDEVPQVYVIQCQHNMIVSGLEVFDIPLLIAGSDFRIYEVPRDEELQALIIEREAAFWKMVEAQTPPEPVNLADAMKRFATSTEEVVTAMPDAIEAVNTLRTLKQRAQDLKADEEGARFTILQALREADTLADAEGNVLLTYKQAKDSSRFDPKAFREAHPDLYASFTKTLPGSRRLLLKGGN